MGLLGMGFGLGFMLGPFIGGELGHFHIIGHQGTLPAFFSAALSLVNLVFALRYLPESLPHEHRRARPIRIVDLAAWRELAPGSGIKLVLLITFTSIFWFTGLQALFRLFTLDAFHMSVAGTGRVLGLVGLTSVVVQGGLIGKLNRRFGETRLLGASVLLMSVGFVLHGVSVSLGVATFLVASVVTALGTALHMPSVSSYISRQVGADRQGTTLGLMQSAGALARAIGPLLWGVLYDGLGLRAPFYIAALATALLLAVVPRLPGPAARAT
jgi:MFS transporter, DHA1 family, tetracycline resistance protein